MYISNDHYNRMVDTYWEKYALEIIENMVLLNDQQVFNLERFFQKITRDYKWCLSKVLQQD